MKLQVSNPPEDTNTDQTPRADGVVDAGDRAGVAEGSPAGEPGCLHVDPAFDCLLPPLTPAECAALREDLKRDGCRDALVVWRGQGIVVGGSRRLQICEEEGIPYKCIEKDFVDRNEAERWILQDQLHRRNLNDDQRAALAYLLLQGRVEESRRERARKGGLAGGRGRGKDSSEDHVDHGAMRTEAAMRQRELMARTARVSQKALRRVSRIAKQDEGMVREILFGLPIKAAEEELRDAERDKLKCEALRKFPNGDGSGIHTGDLSILNDIVPDGSADMVMTDPPYGDVALYGRVAELAQKKLKEGGLCACYAGQTRLPEVLAEMGKHLDYRFLCVVRHDGRSTRLFNAKVSTKIKFIPLYEKRPALAKATHPWVSDLFDGGGENKEHHPWEQPVSEAEYLIERLSEPGGLVIDPCTGSGSIPVACIRTSRRYIAAEIDEGTAALARARCEEAKREVGGNGEGSLETEPENGV